LQESSKSRNLSKNRQVIGENNLGHHFHETGAKKAEGEIAKKLVARQE